MILHLFDRFWGGRVIVLMIPVIVFAIGAVVFTPADLKQITNAIIMGVSLSLCFVWRRSIRIYFVSKTPGLIWLNLAVALLVLTTVISSAYSTYLNGAPPNDLIVAGLRTAYACSFGGLFVAPQANDKYVPPKGWVSLIVIVGLSVLAGVIEVRAF